MMIKKGTITMTDKLLMKGNEAVAEAAVRAGCRFFYGYPITPQSEIPEYMAKRMPQVEGTFLQAESEVAAINMIYGAAATGERAMTSSSSPGISLMQEGISYLAASELPCLIVNIVRGTPGLGGIGPAQADYFQATKGGGHGDYKTIVLAPGSVQEMADHVALAFDLAFKYRNPALILGDGILGQMMEPVTFPKLCDKVPAPEWAVRGKSCGEKKVIHSCYLANDDVENLVHHLFAKYDAIEKNEKRWEAYQLEDAEYVITAFGTTARIVKTAIERLRQEGIKVGLIRPITLWPFPEEPFVTMRSKVKSFLCVEMSMGQMVEDVERVVGIEVPVHFYGRTGGNVPEIDKIVEKVKQMIK